jgi:predicted metal-dependent enzyme (double-stranded beta helix superfamily)
MGRDIPADRVNAGKGQVTMFDLDQFVADLRATLAERSRQAMKEVVTRAVSDPASLLRQLGEPDKGGITTLHHAPDLTIINVAWGPHQVTFPHNHLLSAVIGMYGGREDNMFWRRVPNPTKYQIEAAGGTALGTGDVTVLGRDVIHSVVNPLEKVSGAIHVYDGDFFAIQRSMWDAETLVEQPFDINAVTKGMPLQGMR